MLSFGIFVSGNKMLYFIRHGQTDWNLQKKIQGITDIPLNQKGVADARSAAESVARVKWDRMISSPLLRARQTAEILNKDIGLPIETDERLCEFDLGDLEGQPLSLLTPDVWRALAEDPQRLKAEGLPLAYERISAFMREIPKEPNTLSVMHSGLFKIISYYLKHPNGFDYSLFVPDFRDLWIPNTTLIPVG